MGKISKEAAKQKIREALNKEGITDLDTLVDKASEHAAAEDVNAPVPHQYLWCATSGTMRVPTIKGDG